MPIVLDGTSGITTPDLTDTSLTSGCVVYAGASGNLTGSASLVFDGNNLGVLAGSVTTPATKIHAVGVVRSSNSAGTIHSNLASDGVYSSGTDLYLFAPTGYANIFYANNVERMRLPVAGGLKTSTTISVGNATPSASGAGITFPASVDASSDANTLDDYEEGTWTPTQGAGLTVVGTYSSAGRYTKVGRQVFVTGFASATSISSTANAIGFGGLPFAGSGPAGIGSMTNSTLSQVGATYSDATNIYVSSMTSNASLIFSLTYSI
jgi:hypothetical protein